MAMAAHLPTIYNAREFVEAGGVMSYGLFRRSAEVEKAADSKP